MSRFERLELKDTPKSTPPSWEDPGLVDAAAWLERARDAFVNERYEAALTAYSRALQDDATLVEAWVGQVRCLAELGECIEAVTWADRALERFRDHPDLLAARALALCRGGRSADALVSIDGAFRQPGISAFAWTVRGEVMLSQNAESARHCFMKAVESAPGDADIRLRIALAYIRRARWFEAMEHLQAATGKEPKRATLWARAAQCRDGLGDRASARAFYERALSIEPGLAWARAALAELDSRGWGSRIIGRLRAVLRRG
jgi:tetratricopeptide (TPR) repeat protein